MGWTTSCSGALPDVTKKGARICEIDGGLATASPPCVWLASGGLVDKPIHRGAAMLFDGDCMPTCCGCCCCGGGGCCSCCFALALGLPLAPFWFLGLLAGDCGCCCCCCGCGCGDGEYVKAGASARISCAAGPRGVVIAAEEADCWVCMAAALACACCMAYACCIAACCMAACCIATSAACCAISCWAACACCVMAACCAMCAIMAAAACCGFGCPLSCLCIISRRGFGMALGTPGMPGRFGTVACSPE
mmetsp:Transcript_96106/g.248559  ORF Transcript_96106/g.248559 Transcript_96106/m.248559 type:complete len:249 (+) Transcript_96106:1622-2368(+)